jgi:hypothetical protein
MLPTLYNFFIGYYVGTGIAGDRPVHRVHPSGDSALPNEGRVHTGRLDAGQPLQVDRPDCNRVGLLHQLHLSDAPLTASACRGTTGSRGRRSTNAPILVGGALLLFGGWWVLSAKNWFKGPVRMGTDEELEQLEEQQLGEFALPTEAS